MLYLLTSTDTDSDYSALASGNSETEALNSAARAAGYDDHADLIAQVHGGDADAIEIEQLGEPDGMGVLVVQQRDGDVTLYRDLGNGWQRDEYTCPTNGGYVKRRGDFAGGQWQEDRQVNRSLARSGQMMSCEARGAELAECVRQAAHRSVIAHG